MADAPGNAPLPALDCTRKKCYNSDCTEFTSRKGWRLSSGELAELCDRCASAYEGGKFCETFHPNAPGWRCCHTCGRRLHCGCMVSCNSFQQLDFGGIMCSECARHRFIGAPGTAWLPLFVYDERFKDRPVEKWIHIFGPGPAPLQQAPFFSSSTSHSSMPPRTPHKSGRLIAGGSSSGASEGLQIGNPESAALVLQNKNAGASKEDKAGSSRDIMLLPSSREMPIVSSNEVNGQIVPSETPLQQSSSALVLEEVQGNLHSGVDSTVGTRKRNNRPRIGAYGKGKLQPRYWPKFTSEEMRLIAGNSNAPVTPLFEKMLSATDAGKTGRLVLPKNYAETYFPLLENQGGLSLTIQDTEGKDWIFRYRFWPNNKSRMYVLEGVASYMRHMQLKARDTVTFSRQEPEGKLVMGFRKANLLCDRDNGSRQTGNGVLLIGNASMEHDKRQAGNSLLLIGDASKDNDTRQTSNGVLVIRDTSAAEMADPSLQSKVEGKSSIRKRKSSTLGSKNKHMRIENEEKIELMLTPEEANVFLHPPPNQTPNVVEIEKHEFEEYQDAPVLGKPTVLANDQSGFQVQWVQCDNCFKWRKVPADAHLSTKWTCSDNTWDLERSVCSARQELTAKQLKDLIPSHLIGASKKSKVPKKKVDSARATEGLGTLSRAADRAAITGEKGEPSNASQTTTKHPRHGPDCSCIVCNQPPSDKSPAAKHRSKKRASKQSEREAEPSNRNPQQNKTPGDGSLPSNNAGAGDPNNQPERDGKQILAICGGGEITNSSSQQEPEKDNPATSPVKVSEAA